MTRRHPDTPVGLAHAAPLAIGRSHSSRAALTLIELLASLVLTSLLMTSLVGTLRIAKQHAAAVEDAAALAAWEHILAARLRSDVLNSRLIHVRTKEIRLRGYAGGDAGTDWRPADVVYRIEVAGGRSWLVRVERPLTARSNQPALHEWMLVGCTGLQLSRLDDGTEEPLLPPLAGTPPDISVPSHLRIRLVDQSQDTLWTGSVVQPRLR